MSISISNIYESKHHYATSHVTWVNHSICNLIGITQELAALLFCSKVQSRVQLGGKHWYLKQLIIYHFNESKQDKDLIIDDVSVTTGRQYNSQQHDSCGIDVHHTLVMEIKIHLNKFLNKYTFSAFLIFPHLHYTISI